MSEKKLKKKDFCLPAAFYQKLYRLTAIVNNVLSKNNIQYWTEAGTLLGAIRNRGIIPWDDDVDLKVWRSDYLRILTPDIVSQFNDLGYCVTKESRLDLIKVFPADGTEGRDNYKFPFVDIFSVTLDRDDPRKVIYTHKWARRFWPRDHLHLEEMYPLRYTKFGASKIVVPNNSRDYLVRLFGSSWDTEGQIYQPHVLGIKLDKPLVVRGPFLPAKDFDRSVKLEEAPESLLARPPDHVRKKAASVRVRT